MSNHICNQFERAVAGGGSRRQYPHGTAKHVGVGTIQTLQLAARHWVTTDESCISNRIDDRRLYGPHVGHHTGGGCQHVSNTFGNMRYRGGHDGQLGPGVHAHCIDQLLFHCLLFTIRFVVGPGDVPTIRAKRCGHRTANEAHSEHVRASRHGSLAYGEQFLSAR